MADDHMSRGILAGEFEEVASTLLKEIRAKEAVEPVAYAQALATLALGQRVADLTDRLGDYLGDDSHLDKITQALREIAEPVVDRRSL